jgi:hypothetical protein
MVEPELFKSMGNLWPISAPQMPLLLKRVWDASVIPMVEPKIF